MFGHYDPISERCSDCDGHFRHFEGCPFYEGEPVLDLEARVRVAAIVTEVMEGVGQEA